MSASDVLLVQGGAVLSSEGWLSPGYLTVRGDKVEQVGKGTPPVELVHGARRTLGGPKYAVLPGLVNGHTHFSQTFMRGLAAGRPLLEWLNEIIWPLQNAMTAEDMHLAALLGFVENLLSGVTSVVDHHKVCMTPGHTEAVCEAAEEVGLRLVLARGWADRGTYAEAPRSILEDLENLFERHRGSRRVQIANGPLTPWRCSPELLQETHALAGRYAAPTHVHVSETQVEVRKTQDETGLRPVMWLDELGVLGKDTQVVHGVWVEPAEIERLAERGALLVHCPVSNAVLGSGIAPLISFSKAGVRIRLGTDGPASNDSEDMFETMKFGLCLARATSLDSMGLSPSEVLSWATDGRSLTPGAEADVILVNLDTPRVAPATDIASALVLSASAADVEAVMIGGEILVEDRRVKALDQGQLLEDCRRAASDLRSRVGLTW